MANTFAMTAHRHMKEYGTTVEQFAKVAGIHREHASRKPGAPMTAPIRVDDVLNSRMVSRPYHKLDCSLISDGAAAFVITSAGQARSGSPEAHDPGRWQRVVTHAESGASDHAAYSAARSEKHRKNTFFGH